MAILSIFEKQPADEQDYDIDFRGWLAHQEDTASSCEVSVDDGLRLLSYAIHLGVVKVWLAGGTHRKKYKVSITVTTTGGRVHQEEIVIKVREY